MRNLNIQHDMAWLWFSVETFLGVGHLKSVLELVRIEIGEVMMSFRNDDDEVENRGK